MTRRFLWLAASTGLAALIALLWAFLTEGGIVSRLFLPTPITTWTSLSNGIDSGTLTQAMRETVGRMVAGWVSASLLGIVLGGVIAGSNLLSAMLVPTLEFIRQIPSSAKLPIVIIFMGLTSEMIVVVIALGAVWPVLLASIHGFRTAEPRLLEAARILEMSKLATFVKIRLPSALPDIFAGLRIGLTVSLILAVVGEILTGLGGLGDKLMEASRLYRSDDLFAGMLLLGFIGFVANLVLAVAGKQLIRR